VRVPHCRGDVLKIERELKGVEECPDCHIKQRGYCRQYKKGSKWRFEYSKSLIVVFIYLFHRLFLYTS